MSYGSGIRDSFICMIYRSRPLGCRWILVSFFYLNTKNISFFERRHTHRRSDSSAPPLHIHTNTHPHKQTQAYPCAMCAMTHMNSYVRHEPLTCATCHDSFVCVPWLIHMCDMTHSYVRHDSFMCDMTHSHVRHDSFICATWLIHMCDMTYLCLWHDSFICVTWLIHMCDMTHSYVWHDSFMCVTWLIHLGVKSVHSQQSRRVLHVKQPLFKCFKQVHRLWQRYLFGTHVC